MQVLSGNASVLAVREKKRSVRLLLHLLPFSLVPLRCFQMSMSTRV